MATEKQILAAAKAYDAHYENCGSHMDAIEVALAAAEADRNEEVQRLTDDYNALKTGAVHQARGIAGAKKAESERDAAFTCAPPFVWTDIKPGYDRGGPYIDLLDEEGQSLGVVIVLKCEGSIVRADVERALNAAGNPAKMRRFMQAARNGEAEANDRAELALAAAEKVEAEAAELIKKAIAARKEGLEDAAKIAESRYEVWHAGEGTDVCDDITCCEDIAAAIRARIAEVAKTT